MKKLIYLLLIPVLFIACSEQKAVKQIPLTSDSPEAIALMREFMTNQEQRRRYLNEDILDSILKLDPNFNLALALNNFKGRDVRRRDLIKAYESKDKVSEIEAMVISGIYEQTINGDGKKHDELLAQAIEKYPEYYQLYLWSGNVKNSLRDAKGSQVMWKKAIEIYPECFEALESLAFLHFPVDNSFQTLAEVDQDLEEAEELLNRIQKYYPNSHVPSRFLGNVYRAKNDFTKAEAAYKKTIDILEKNIDLNDPNQNFQYSNALLMMGHINTFQGRYDAGRDFYTKGIDVIMDDNGVVDRQQENWVKTNYTIYQSHAYMYEKNYSDAVFLLSSLYNQIDDFDRPEIEKNNTKFFTEFSKFLVLAHSQNEEETINSLATMSDLREANKILLLEQAVDEREKYIIEWNMKSNTYEMDIWYNILFGYYEKANDLLQEFKLISTEGLEWNPNAMNVYNQLAGYNALMEGNPQTSLEFYSKVPDENLDDDNYHKYFKALALRAVGNEEESNIILTKLANNNFATWQNSVVKNLAKAQIKTNL
jgi:hypothetical protein